MERGTKDGQTKFVREGGGVMAYGWSLSKGEWEKIGEVVAGPGGGGSGGGGGKKVRLRPLERQCVGRICVYVFTLATAMHFVMLFRDCRGCMR